MQSLNNSLFIDGFPFNTSGFTSFAQSHISLHFELFLSLFLFSYRVARERYGNRRYTDTHVLPFIAATTPKDCSPTLSPLNAFSRSMDNSSLSRSVEQLSSPLESEPRRNKQPPPVVAPAAHSRSSATRGGTWGSISR